MKIAAVISTISGGGAARALVNVVNHWVGQGREVTLLTLDDPTADFYEVHPGVGRIGLGMMAPSRWIGESVARNVSRLRALRDALQEAGGEVVIAVEDRMAVRTLLATRGSSLPVAVWEQVDPRRLDLSWPWRSLRRMLYPRAAVLAVQVDRLRPWAGRYVAPERIRVIPNPAVPPDARGGVDGDRDEAAPGTVLAVGRLVPQKGFDLLLEAFAYCVRRHPNWRLAIVGDGPEGPKLERRAVKLGIDGRVDFEGRVRDVASHYGKADLFVLSSRFEGFPNVLLEAMGAGLPVVSFDCPSGPREIIRDGEDGVLVPAEDAEALASELSRLMGDREERRRLGRRATEVTDRFGVDRVAEAWDRAFEFVVGEGRTRCCRDRSPF